MTVPTANELLTTQFIRTFIQPGGARPGNSPLFYGVGAQYLYLDGVSIPQSGAVAPFFVPDPRQAGEYHLATRTIAAPNALPKATVNLTERLGAVPRQLAKFPTSTLYEVVGQCTDLSSFLKGAQYGMVVYSDGIAETKTPGKRGAWNAATPLEDKVALTFQYIYPLGPLTIGSKDTNTTETVSVCYASHLQGANCGTSDNGTQRLYKLNKHGVGAANVDYSTDGGATWSAKTLTGIGATADPDRIRVMGSYLVVTSSTEDAIYVAAINPDTGVPGTFAKVTTGFVTAKGPTDLVVYSENEAYLCGLGGYLYKCVDPTAGVTVLNAGAVTAQNLARITANGDTLVAVAAGHKVIVSGNRGVTWAATAADPGAADLTAVSVPQPGLIWVGNASGAVYYSENGGASWTQRTAITGLAAVADIAFVTKEVGYIAGVTAAPLGVLWATCDGGNSWGNSPSTMWRILSALTVKGINELAFPDVAGSDPETAVDNLALACLDAAGTGGDLLMGSTVVV